MGTLASGLPRLVGMDDVQEMTGYTRRGVEQMVRTGTFPPPIRLGRSIKWRLQAILDHLDGLERRENVSARTPALAS